MWAGNLSKLEWGACLLLMTPHTLYCTSVYCSFYCTYLLFSSAPSSPFPSAPPALHTHTHTRGVQGDVGGTSGGLVPGSNLSESINQTDLSFCHRHLECVHTHSHPVLCICAVLRWHGSNYKHTKLPSQYRKTNPEVFSLMCAE